MSTNVERAERGLSVLQAYRDTYQADIDDQTTLIDLLADLLHLVHVRQLRGGEDALHFTPALQMARMHFEEELLEEEAQP